MRWAPLLAVVLCACQRKAPGPAECVRYARHVHGVASDAVLASPRVSEQVDALTRLCLTTPFDRELISCVESTGRIRACSTEFEYRRRRRMAGDDAERVGR